MNYFAQALSDVNALSHFIDGLLLVAPYTVPTVCGVGFVRWLMNKIA